MFGRTNTDTLCACERQAVAVLPAWEHSGVQVNMDDEEADESPREAKELDEEAGRWQRWRGISMEEGKKEEKKWKSTQDTSRKLVTKKKDYPV